MISNKQNLRTFVCEKGELTAVEIKNLVGKDNPVILEIGANDGGTTIDFLKAMPHARIFCFEPDPRAIALFKSHITHGNVQLIETAVGSQNGITQFHQSNGKGHLSGWHKSGSIRAPKSHLQVWPQITFETQINVPICRLDDWFSKQGIDEVDFIWADVQGAEYDLIAGATETLQKTRYFYTEYSNSEWYEGQIGLQKIYNLLGSYEISRLFRMDVLFKNLTLV